MNAGKNKTLLPLSMPLIFAATFALLTLTLRDPGMSWDEGNDVRMAKGAAQWFGLIGEKGSRPFSRAEIERYWGYEWKQHPAVTRIIHAAAWSISNRFGDGPAYREWLAFRFGTIAVFSALAALVFHAGRRYLGGPSAGAAAFISLLCMPRMFGHAHLVETDMVLCALYFAAALCFLKGLETRWGSVAFGVLLGLLPAVKFTGLFAAIPLFLWGLVFARGKLSRNLAAAVLLAPPAFFLVQPMYWHQPLAALGGYFSHFLDPKTQSTIVVYYFGQFYRQSPPWTYPYVMTALSVPITILIPAAAGLFPAARKSDSRPMVVFLIVNMLFFLLFFTPSRVAVYDGERLFMMVFPFLALLAGAGFQFLIGRFHISIRVAAVVLYAALCAASLAQARPYYLAYYNGLIGGVRGAERRGLEVTYWGEAFTPEFADVLNNKLPNGARLTTIGYFSGNFKYFQDMGLLRSDLRIVDYGAEADFIIIFNRVGVLDPLTIFIVKKTLPLAAVRWRGVQLAGVYVLKPGLELLRRKAEEN